MKRLFILGSTGSVGRKVIEVVRRFPDDFRIVGLTGARNYAQLAKQAVEFNVPTLALHDWFKLYELKKEFPGKKIYQASSGGLTRAVQETDFDLLVNAVVGLAGLLPTMEAITKGVDVALANKEILVATGRIIMDAAAEHQVNIIPIDSEHSAIFHLLRGIPRKEVRQLLITASGGPFLNKEIGNPTIEGVLNHPTWSMGRKISVDCATMINKGFEVIEAHHLFTMPYQYIKVIIHPQSIVHSMVETVDGAIYAQMGPRNMCLPIQNALTFPESKNAPQRLDLTAIGTLTFHAPDFNKFPLLRIACECGRKAGLWPVILNAADEVAVQAFLERKITFKDISQVIEMVLDTQPGRIRPDLQDVLAVDKEVRRQTRKIIESRSP